eukprot:scaffold189456_cov15-Tisochrysis_lutea.AAC.1
MGKRDAAAASGEGYLRPTWLNAYVPTGRLKSSSSSESNYVSSKGRYSSSLISVNACRDERLLEQGVEVPDNTSRAVPDWIFLNGTVSSAQH